MTISPSKSISSNDPFPASSIPLDISDSFRASQAIPCLTFSVQGTTLNASCIISSSRTLGWWGSSSSNGKQAFLTCTFSKVFYLCSSIWTATWFLGLGPSFLLDIPGASMARWTLKSCEPLPPPWSQPIAAPFPTEPVLLASWGEVSRLWINFDSFSLYLWCLSISSQVLDKGWVDGIIKTNSIKHP